MNKIQSRRLFLAPITIFLLLLTIFPLAYLIVTSLTDRAATSPSTNFIGLANYKEIFLDAEFRYSLFVTFVITFCSVSLQVIFGLVLALSFSNIRSNLWLLRALYLIPMAAAPVATLFNWRFMLSSSSGIINYIISFLGITEIGWLDSRNMALISIVMVETWLWTPFVFVILIAAISSIDPSVLDAAAIDGAGRIRIAFSIYIPMIKPFLIIALVLRIIDSAKSFDTIQILTQGGPGYDTASFNFLIFKNAIEYLNFGYASAEAIVLLVILLVISRFLFNKIKVIEG